MPRIALAMARGGNAGTPKPRDPSGETSPRSYVFDEAFAPNWDESILGRSKPSKIVPTWWRMAREVQRLYAEYDAVVTWGEKLSLAMLMQQQVARVKKPHIAMMYQFEKPNIRIPLGAFKENLHAVVTWSSVQRRALIDRLHYPADRVYLIRHYVDQVFYSPRPAEESMICARGSGDARLRHAGRSAQGHRYSMPHSGRPRARAWTIPPPQRSPCGSRRHHWARRRERHTGPHATDRAS